ncbi:MAG: ATP-dependent zinc protease [Gammaproteobacteria bacterium]|nr:ATP-dependent zinc protease [Gammaproteobacteria bacterium]
MITVGWHEKGSLPLLGIRRLPIKIDTGAKTSSLHATDIEVFNKDDSPWVRFKTVNTLGEAITIEAEMFDKREIKSSNGQVQARYVIKTMLEMGGEQWPIQLTLANRKKMRFKMLLGRRAMGNMKVLPTKADLLSS